MSIIIYVFYLLSHGAANLAIVDRAAAREALGLSGDLRGAEPLHRLPAPPLHYVRDPGLIILSVLDLIVMALAWNEYRQVKRGLFAPGASAPIEPAAMQRLTLAGGIPESLRGSIVALGNFDGFHLGHQAVVSRAVARAFHERRPVIVATFDPHPVKFFKPDLPPFG